ncbi:MAG: isoprenylcysteine carboxylmethyltransferase family protein [Actinomycetota bacterium]
MRAAALAIYGVFALVALVVRSFLHRKATGRSPFPIPSSALAWLGQSLLSAGIVGSPAGVAFGEANDTVVAVVGLVLSAAGVVVTIVAQEHMGASWRAGLDPGERTELVTRGLFRRVRNPIYAAMIVVGVGMALVVFNVVTVVSVVAILAGAEIVVRGVEEPYLLRMHEGDFTRYAARTGRFFPGVGERRG